MTVFYHYDLNGLLLSENYSNTTGHVDYVSVDNRHLAIYGMGSSVVYLHTDHLNTPRFATNAAKSVVWNWQSDAFGVKVPVANQPNLVVINLRFPGQYYDMETGLYYNYHRYYDPQTGRYISSDPIGLSGGVNTFGYVEQNPLSFVDPLGLIKHTSGKTISCGKCTIRIDYTFDEKTGIKRRHLHWNCKGKEGSCGENGEESHGGTWDDAPENVKECARAAGFQGESVPDMPRVIIPGIPDMPPITIEEPPLLRFPPIRIPIFVP